MSYHYVPIEQWVANHRAGMAASASKTAAHRLSGPTLAAVRKSGRENHPCKIEGCKRTAYKGSLCRGHYDLVPMSMRMDLAVACIQAQIKTAAKHHRLHLAHARKVLRETT